MNKKDVISKLFRLYLVILELETHNNFDNEVIRYEDGVRNAEKAYNEHNGRKEFKNYLMAQADLSAFKLAYSEFDKSCLKEYEGFLDKKYWNTSDLFELQKLLESGKAETLEQAVSLLNNP